MIQRVNTVKKPQQSEYQTGDIHTDSITNLGEVVNTMDRTSQVADESKKQSRTKHGNQITITYSSTDEFQFSECLEKIIKVHVEK